MPADTFVRCLAGDDEFMHLILDTFDTSTYEPVYSGDEIGMGMLRGTFRDLFPDL